MQLPGYAPWPTTFQLSEPASRFGRNIESALRLSGYGVQRVSADQGRKYLAYSTSSVISNEGSTSRYTLSVNRLSITRDYTYANGVLSPTSLITVVGVPPTRITINDDLYLQRGGNRVIPSGVEFKSEDGVSLVATKKQLRVGDNNKLSLDEQFSHQRFLVLTRARLFLNSKLSNSENVNDWTPMNQVLLTFPSRDTSVLGENNKSAIKRMLSLYNPLTHGFSITGCKGKSTLLWDGTEGDSLERQQRVREELLVAGIDISRVREDGCFQNEFDDLLKRNSVVLTLRAREIDQLN